MADYDYDAMYRATGPDAPPWEIGGPQPALAAVLDEVRGPRVLDVGCGTGELAVTLARRGLSVTGVDMSPVAIARAAAKAAGLDARFLVRDATTLSLPGPPFDTVIDSGLLHTLVRGPAGPAEAYLARLPELTAPGGLVLVLAVTRGDGQPWGVTAEFLEAAFAPPVWTGFRADPVTVIAREVTLPALLMRAERAQAGTPS